MEIIFATGNAHKAMEAQSILGETFTVIMPKELGITDDIPENCDTLLGNAVEKCTYLWKICKRACFADDTGLEVNALGGAPGVHTARYAGEGKESDANMNKLLAELQKLGPEYGNPAMRRARFRTVIAYKDKKGELHTFEGVLEGHIACRKSGNLGFGYDPVFVPDETGGKTTLAEVPAEVKNAISHRGKAIRALKNFLENDR